MIYIQRDEHGALLKVEATPFAEMTGVLDEPTSETNAFVSYKSIEQGIDQLKQSDQEMIRVLEDLIYALIGKGLLNITDLPVAAQAKLLDRSKARDALGSASMLLAEADEEQLL